MAIISGTINVATAGTRVQAAHKGTIRTVLFKARAANTGKVYLGGSDVSSSAGMALAPGEAIPVNLKDPISTAQFWADADTNNDKVDFLGTE